MSNESDLCLPQTEFKELVQIPGLGNHGNCQDKYNYEYPKDKSYAATYQTYYGFTFAREIGVSSYLANCYCSTDYGWDTAKWNEETYNSENHRG
jgi:hypothetical protein